MIRASLSRWLAVALCWFLLAATPARAIDYPPKPPDNQFILDRAGMLPPADAQKIQQLSATLLAEKRIPIVVVTIESLGAYGAGDWTIERYAGALFNTWGIGSPDYNYGILLLISQGDRKARIELGDGWKRDYDDSCLQIMDELIIPEFKQRRFSEGILAGVQALNAMARGQDIPHRSLVTRVGDQANATWTWLLGRWQYLALPLIFAGGGVYNRWAYGAWWNSDDDDDRRGWGSGWSGSWGGGGGFGGGCSGSGGASGSW